MWTWICVKTKTYVWNILLLYQYRIFELDPDTAPLFKFGSDGVSEGMFRRESFLQHSRGVIKTVDLAIELLQARETETLITALRDLGAKHAMYKVSFVHFPILEQALFSTLEKTLGDDFTVETKQAWTTIFKFIEKHMKDGMEDFL